jgi:hypothetical protein
MYDVLSTYWKPAHHVFQKLNYYKGDDDGVTRNPD